MPKMTIWMVSKYAQSNIFLSLLECPTIFAFVAACDATELNDKGLRKLWLAGGNKIFNLLRAVVGKQRPVPRVKSGPPNLFNTLINIEKWEEKEAWRGGFPLLIQHRGSPLPPIAGIVFQTQIYWLV